MIRFWRFGAWMVVFLLVMVALILRDLPDGRFHAWVLDVGQGDAILIQTPGGDQILIDGGPSNQVIPALSARMPFWDRTIERVVLSHPHADHLDGLIDVATRYRIGEVWQSGATHTTADYTSWQNVLAERQIPTRAVKAGDILEWGGLTFEVLFPLDNALGQAPKDQHDATVVIRALIEGRSLLLTGDIDEDYERAILAAWCPDRCEHLDSDILKVPHHGSRTGLLPDFLEKISPEVAIVSVGEKNLYGHPHTSILERLTQAGIRTLRTDRDGTVEVDLTNEGLVVEPD